MALNTAPGQDQPQQEDRHIDVLDDVQKRRQCPPAQQKFPTRLHQNERVAGVHQNIERRGPWPLAMITAARHVR